MCTTYFYYERKVFQEKNGKNIKNGKLKKRLGGAAVLECEVCRFRSVMLIGKNIKLVIVDDIT